ncbi:MAG TPA: VWA domain-containing protein [Pyrinomonadaceae bacterium]|nr:VWA domain-containing protein [Pyrinomonadaceae bacterium]
MRSRRPRLARLVYGLAACALVSAALAASYRLPPASGAARPQDDDEETVRVNAVLIVLNVTVTDKGGRYVPKLARADFQVLEDGREQTVSTFGVEETPFAAALLLDTSGSMEKRVSLARSAAIRFLDGLREEDTAAVYSFNSKVEQLQDFSPGRDLPPMAFEMEADGMTALNDAVLKAARDLSARPEKRRAILVLSDGADTKSGASADKALNAAIAAGATIYTVDMSDPRAQGVEKHVAAAALRFFAEKSGGRYVPTPGGQALSNAFAGIAEELRHQYTLGYQPSNRARDGRWRALEVKVARADIQVRTRRGYHAPKR